MTAVVGGVGHYVPFDGGCLLIGRDVGVVPVHAHYAIQVAFGAEPGLCFRPADDAPWTAYDGAVIASRQPHGMDGTRTSANAVLFVEPETRAGRAIAERYLEAGIAALPDGCLADVRPALFAAWRARSGPAVAAAAARVVGALAGGVEPSVVSDPRILRAVAWVNAHLDAPLTLEEVAAEACLSPSRFRHLFVAETGMALRPYILWRRFLHVWALVSGGASLSQAAHAAGFADAAHLSRTSRRIFGFPPSAMQMAEPLRVGHDTARAAGIEI